MQKYGRKQYSINHCFGRYPKRRSRFTWNNRNFCERWRARRKKY